MWWIFNCIICGKEMKMFSVNEPNKQCPCIDCQLKELRKEKQK